MSTFLIVLILLLLAFSVDAIAFDDLPAELKLQILSEVQLRTS